MTTTTQKTIKHISKEEARQTMNDLGSRGEAFFFLFDFELNKPIIFPKRQLKNQPIWVDINGKRNFRQQPNFPKKVELRKWAMAKKNYAIAFDLVQQEINKGNSYLLNLTFPTEIETNFTFKEIFLRSRAKYKLWLPNNLVVFSPETFIKIYDSKIASFPMKGTIDADLPNAAEQILSDKKEKAEHCTIVDLIRNDLNLVSTRVEVERFRYLDHLTTSQKNLLQVSSKITGILPTNYRENIGDILNPVKEKKKQLLKCQLD